MTQNSFDMSLIEGTQYVSEKNSFREENISQAEFIQSHLTRLKKASNITSTKNYSKPMSDMTMIAKELDSIIDISKQLDRTHIKVRQIKCKERLDFTSGQLKNSAAQSFVLINDDKTIKQQSNPPINKVLLNNPRFNILTEKIYLNRKENHYQVQQLNNYPKQHSYETKPVDHSISDKKGSSFIISDSSDKNRLISKYSSNKSGMPYFRTPSRKTLNFVEKSQTNSLNMDMDKKSQSFDNGLASQIIAKNNIQIIPKRISTAFADTKFRSNLFSTSKKKTFHRSINHQDSIISQGTVKDQSIFAYSKLGAGISVNFPPSGILARSEVKEAIVDKQWEDAIKSKFDLKNSSISSSHWNTNQKDNLSTTMKNFKEPDKAILYYQGLSNFKSSNEEMQSLIVSHNDNIFDYLSTDDQKNHLINY